MQFPSSLVGQDKTFGPSACPFEEVGQWVLCSFSLAVDLGGGGGLLVCLRVRARHILYNKTQTVYGSLG